MSTASGLEVADGRVVVIHYTLTRDDGQLVESSRGKAPLAYLHGRGSLLSGMEKALAGQQAGAKLDIELAPEEAFGARQGPGPQAVPRKELPKNLELFVGRPLDVPGSDGQNVRLWVTKVQGARVWLDVDHPLAGHKLRFDVEVLRVREPTAEEIEHGHAHGPDGVLHGH
ncbi:MAG: peptidylprolyl isomerase [Myxococcota bacterium]